MEITLTTDKNGAGEPQRDTEKQRTRKPENLDNQEMQLV